VEPKSRVVGRRRFTTEEYHKMAEVGILHEDDRVELIEGDIIEMTPMVVVLGARS
jgi:Uma2 family endonuclease